MDHHDHVHVHDHENFKRTSSTEATNVMAEKIRKAAHMVKRGERPLMDSPVLELIPSDMLLRWY